MTVPFMKYVISSFGKENKKFKWVDLDVYWVTFELFQKLSNKSFQRSICKKKYFPNIFCLFSWRKFCFAEWYLGPWDQSLLIMQRITNVNLMWISRIKTKKIFAKQVLECSIRFIIFLQLWALRGNIINLVKTLQSSIIRVNLEVLMILGTDDYQICCRRISPCVGGGNFHP